jgi:hypothetical protein
LPLRKAITFLLLLLFVTSLFAEGISVDNNLTLVIPGSGINAAARWFEAASVLIQPAEEKYVVVNNKRDVKKVCRLVPKDHILVYDQKDIQGYEKRLREIGELRNATVVIDMALYIWAISAVNRPWDEQAEWAARTAVILAEAHHKKFLNNNVSLIGYSSGTEAVAMAQQFSCDPARAGSEFPLFRSWLASPRTLDEKIYPDKKNTTMIIADGDWKQSPGGKVGLYTLRKMGEKDAMDFARQGFNVIRIKNKFGYRWLSYLGCTYANHRRSFQTKDDYNLFRANCNSYCSHLRFPGKCGTQAAGR